MRKLRMRDPGSDSIPIAILLVAVSAVAANTAVAQDAGQPPPDVLERLYPGRTYSPYAERSFPSRVYWGDTHLT